MRRYGETTKVPIHRSRAEIDKLLRTWGADAVQWGDDFTNGVVTLRFKWQRLEGTATRIYLARIEIRTRTQEQLSRDAIGMRGYSSVLFAKLQADNGKAEHRILLLWLKAAFNAIDAKIITAEALFLPFFEGADGQTVAETVIPRMAKLLSGSAQKLLGNGT